MGLFIAYDPEASFKPESEGLKDRRLVTSWGSDKLGEAAWALGHRAYEALRTEMGDSVSLRDLVEYVTSSRAELSQIFQEVEELFEAGRLVLVSPRGEELASMPSWKESDWPWQVMTIGKLISAVADDATETARVFSKSYLVAALCRLDDAVVCADLDDFETMTSMLLDVQWLVEQVEHLEQIDNLATKQLRRLDSERAVERALAKHSRDPRQAAKSVVRECWDDWLARPSTYPSTAAFARAMLDKFPDVLSSQPVIERWVRAWKRGL